VWLVIASSGLGAQNMQGCPPAGCVSIAMIIARRCDDQSVCKHERSLEPKSLNLFFCGGVHGVSLALSWLCSHDDNAWCVVMLNQSHC